MRVKLEQNRAVLKVQIVKDKKVVRSHDFYKYVNLYRYNYPRWMNDTVFPLGERGRDYFPAPDNIERKGAFGRIKNRVRYYFSIDFAISLCHVVRTKESMQLKEFLLGEK